MLALRFSHFDPQLTFVVVTPSGLGGPKADLNRGGVL